MISLAKIALGTKINIFKNLDGQLLLRRNAKIK
jgi:hypothetical protein